LQDDFIKNSTKTIDIEAYGSYFTHVFTSAFDNNYTPYYGLMISLWGAYFMEIWKRENARLAYEWDVDNFETNEPNLAEYERKLINKTNALKTANFFVKFIIKYDNYFKKFIGFLVMLIMIGIVALDIAVVITVRLYLKLKVINEDDTVGNVSADVASLILNTIFIIVLNLIYESIACTLTQWENNRTKTDYEDSLINKLFAFQFVNTYGSLYYLAFFRDITYPNGIFNLGSEYQDNCGENSCMSLITIQIMINLFIKPLSRFFTTIIYPILYKYYKKYRFKKTNIIGDQQSDANDDTIYESRDLNEKLVLINILAENTKLPFADTIAEEYMEKVIMFGYLMVNSFN
jgi:hypothetical protein